MRVWERRRDPSRRSHRHDCGEPRDPAGKFFRVFKGRDRQPLDPAEWIEKIEFSEPEPPEEPPSAPAEPIHDDGVRGAIQDWRQCAPGGGNAGFWRLANRLAAA